MVIKNRALAVWGEVVAVLLAMTRKGKIVPLPIGVMHQGRVLLQARIAVVVVDSGVVTEEETGWNEVNLIHQI
jgi:hypothetical protein